MLGGGVTGAEVLVARTRQTNGNACRTEYRIGSSEVVRRFEGMVCRRDPQVVCVDGERLRSPRYSAPFLLYLSIYLGSLLSVNTVGTIL